MVTITIVIIIIVIVIAIAIVVIVHTVVGFVILNGRPVHLNISCKVHKGSM